MVFSLSISLNLVNSQIYLRFLLLLSFITKLELMFYLNFSQSENRAQMTVSWMSRQFCATIAAILHMKGVTSWYSLRYYMMSLANILRVRLLLISQKSLAISSLSFLFLHLSNFYLNSLNSYSPAALFSVLQISGS